MRHLVASWLQSASQSPLEATQGAYFVTRIGDPPRGRTENLRIKSPLLCQLS